MIKQKMNKMTTHQQPLEFEWARTLKIIIRYVLNMKFHFVYIYFGIKLRKFEPIILVQVLPKFMNFEVANKI